MRLIGVRPDEPRPRHRPRSRQALKSAYLRVRVRDVSHPALTEGAAAARGDHRGGVHPRRRGADRRPRGVGRRHGRRRGGRAARRAPPWPAAARRPGGDAVRITSLALDRRPPVSRPRVRAVARPDRRPRAQRGRQVDAPAGDRARADPQGDELRRRPRRPGPVGRDPDVPDAICMTFTYEDEDGDRTRAGWPSRSAAPRARSAWSWTARSSRTRPRPTRSWPRSPASRPRASSARPHPSATTSSPGLAARRGRAPRPAPGVDQRRRPRHQPREAQARPRDPRPAASGVKNPGRIKVAEDAVSGHDLQFRAGEDALRASSATATRCRMARERRADARRP